MKTANNSTVTMPWQGALATVVVLILLYFSFVLRDWHYVEDVRAMVVPFVAFGLFSGALLSVMPLAELAPEIRRSAWVFLVAAVIPSCAILIHIRLIIAVGFAPVFHSGEYRSVSEDFYRVFAVFSVIFFGFATMCGFYSSLAIKNSILSRLSLNINSLEQKARNEFIASAVTTLIGIIGAIITALVGGKAA